jgi:predicted RNase H-like nuclease (RuvC/YqgF family)
MMDNIRERLLPVNAMKVVNEAWRDAIIEERDKEIQRLKNELAEKQRYVLQVERYGGQLRAALEEIRWLSYDDRANKSWAIAKQALEEE